jgi:NADPH2 dehydrogenase
MTYRRVASLKTAGAFRQHLADAGIALEFDDEVQAGEQAPLAQPYRLPGGRLIGNRFCVLPMEGWDGTSDGRPSELTARRWRRFGLSGAKLIWGGEAAAVRPDGRANPNQLIVSPDTVGDLVGLRRTLLGAQHERWAR